MCVISPLFFFLIFLSHILNFSITYINLQSVTKKLKVIRTKKKKGLIIKVGGAMVLSHRSCMVRTYVPLHYDFIISDHQSVRGECVRVHLILFLFQAHYQT